MRKNNHICCFDSNFQKFISNNHIADKSNIIKKRVFIFVIFFIAAVFLIPVARYAFADEGNEQEELNQYISDLLGELDLNELDRYLTENSQEFLSGFGNNAKEILEYVIEGNLNVDYGSYIKDLFSVIFKDALSLIPAFTEIVAIAVISAVATSAMEGVISKSTGKIIRLVCYSVIVLIISSLLTGVVTQCISCISAIQKQIEIIAPLLITLTVLTGGNSSAAIYQPSAVFLSNGAVEIISGFIFPATIALIILNFISKLNPQISFGGVTKLIKSILKWTMGIIVAVFGLFITVQSSATSLFDGIIFKATKYLVGNSVPLVGNFLSSGVDMLVAAGLLIKNSVGVCGIIMLLCEVIQPVITLVAFSLILKLVGAIVQPLGENTLFSLFSDLSSDIEYFLAGLLTVSFMYCLVVMLVVNSANSFV